MKKLTCLLLSVVFCGPIVYGQQPAGSSPDSSGSALFVSFTATAKDANKVLLEWDADSAGDGDYFIIERSPDEIHFETIGVVRATSGVPHYETMDGAAPNGSDFYRIKYTARTGVPVYSKTMQLSLS